MTFLLRRVRQSKWNDLNIEYLRQNAGDIPALKDLQPEDNKLSVYEISEKCNLDRIIAALAATRQSIANFDYILIEKIPLEEAGFHFEETLGETADDVVNKAHRDIIVTVEQCPELFFAIMKNVEDSKFAKRIYSNAVEDIILASIRSECMLAKDIEIKTEEFIEKLKAAKLL